MSSFNVVSDFVRGDLSQVQRNETVVWLGRSVSTMVAGKELVVLALAALALVGITYFLYRQRKASALSSDKKSEAPSPSPGSSLSSSGSSLSSSDSSVSSSGSSVSSSEGEGSPLPSPRASFPSAQQLSLRWPKNLDQIKITPEEQKVIVSFVNQNQNVMSGCALENPFVAKGGTLPRSLVCFKGAIIVLLGKKGGMSTLQGGGERPEIKLGWELLKGKFVVKKNVRNFESKLYSTIVDLQQRKQAPSSFPRILGIRKMGAKLQVFERKYEGNLASLYGGSQRPSGNFLEIQKLLEGVAFLHGLEFSFSVNGSELRGSGYHGDPSFKNIVYKTKLGGKIVYKLIDFGLADPNQFGGTEVWLPPEYFVQKKKGFADKSEQLRWNLENGRKKDVWGFGLLVGSMLRGLFVSIDNPSLPCFDFILRLNSVEEIAQITQQEIDQEIQKVTNSIRSGNFQVKSMWRKAWQYVNSMLQVDPEKRVDMRSRPLQF